MKSWAGKQRKVWCDSDGKEMKRRWKCYEIWHVHLNPFESVDSILRITYLP